MSDPQALHVTRNVIPGKLGVDLHLHRVHIPLVIFVDTCYTYDFHQLLISFCLSQIWIGICGREVPYDKELLERYRKALDRAVQLATIHNIQPIPGTTVILCDLRPSMHQPCSSAKGLGRPRTVSSVVVSPTSALWRIAFNAFAFMLLVGQQSYLDYI